MPDCSTYVALTRFVKNRTLVVVMPEGIEGPRIFVQAGAKQVFVTGLELVEEEGVESLEGHEHLSMASLEDQSVDLVVCMEAYAHLSVKERRCLIQAAKRVLGADGMFIARIAAEEERSSSLDYWTFEDELSLGFEEIETWAQMPWQGYSVVPLYEDGDPREQEPTRLELNDALLQQQTKTAYYLAFASAKPERRCSEKVCILVPIAADDVEELEQVTAHRDELLAKLCALRANLEQKQHHIQELAQEIEALSESLRIQKVEASRSKR